MHLKDLQLQTYFPTVIGAVDYTNYDSVKEKYIKLESQLPHDNVGVCYYSFHNDENFKDLFNWIELNVNLFAKAHKFPDTYKIGESWSVDYPINTNQAFHTHDGWIISGVFYLNVHESDTGTTFKTPIKDMQNPLGVNAYTSEENKFYNDYTYKTIDYYPKNGRLVLFRSYVEHEVKAKQDNGFKRTIISFNCHNENYVNNYEQGDLCVKMI